MLKKKETVSDANFLVLSHSICAGKNSRNVELKLNNFYEKVVNGT